MTLSVVSGCTGQIGSYLCEFLLNKGHRVVGLKRRTSTINATSRIDHLLSDPNFQLEYFDLNDPTSMIRVFRKFLVDEFYNLGAQSHVRVSYDVPIETAETTGMGVLRLLETIREEAEPEMKFFQMSSSEMFGINPNVPYTELSTFMPASPYACAKVFAHHCVQNYRSAFYINARCGICFNSESTRRGENFVTRKITLGIAKIKLGLERFIRLGNLSAYRDWTHALDTVEGIYKIMKHSSNEDFILASGETHKVAEFLEKTFEVAGIKDWQDKVIVDPRYYRPQEVPYLLGDASKAKKLLGWQPQIKFDELIEKMYSSDYNMLKKCVG